MNTKDILKRARKLIENRWTKDHLHRTNKNKHCYCAIGACMRAAQMADAGYICPVDSIGDYSYLEGYEYRDNVQSAISLLTEVTLKERDMEIVDFNDDEKTTRKDVLRIFNKAIKQA